MEGHEKFMKIAIEETRRGIIEGNRPFGAILVKDGEVVAKAHNTTIQDNDPTAHAELNLIRAFSRKIKSWDLSEYTLYSTCEPCPMCTSAIGWANIKKLVFGSYMNDEVASPFQRQSNTRCEDNLKKEGINIEIVKGVLRDEILQMYREYEKINS